MASRRVRWGNIEKAALGHLKPDVAPVPIYTQKATEVPDEYVLLQRVGGNRSTPIDREVSIEITIRVPAGERDRLWDLAADVESSMLALAMAESHGVYVDEVTEPFGFAVEPTAAGTALKATATFDLTVRPSA